MSPSVDPKPEAPASAPRVSFSPLPDAVLSLVRDGRLLRADAPLLHALLTHKRRGRDEVWPQQRTLADALGCSVRTVQRGLGRLCAANLIAKCPRRTPSGARARGLRYDLSPLAALLPAGAPRLTSGQWGGVGDTRHGCRPESKKDVDSESDTAPAVAAVEVSPVEISPEVVALLTRAGVFPSAASRLVAEHGAGRCRAALSALAGRPNVRDRAAWLVACLRDGWAVAKPSSPVPPASSPGSPEARHSSLKGRESVAVGSAAWQALDNRGTPPPPDPLDALPPEQYGDWERRARAELIADVALGPVVRGSLARGRSTFLVRARMRQWLPPGPF